MRYRAPFHILQPAGRRAGRNHWWSCSSRQCESDIVAHGVGRFCRKFYDLRITSVLEPNTDTGLDRPPSLSVPPSLPLFLPPSFLLPSVTSGRARAAAAVRGRERGTVTPALTAICTADVTTDEWDPGEREMRKPPAPRSLACQRGKVGQPCRFCQVQKREKQTSTSTFRSRPVAWKQRSATWLIAAWCTSLKSLLVLSLRSFRQLKVLAGSSLLAQLASVELPWVQHWSTTRF